MKRSLIVSVAASVVLACSAHASRAHHVDDGQTPTTLWGGLLSGLAHPILGADHLAFILAIGLATTFLVAGTRVALVFGVALGLGVIGHVLGLSLPAGEVLVAASVLLIGAALISRRARDPMLWLAFAGITGWIHGHALGEPVVGSTLPIIVSYLVGLAVALLLLLVPVKALAQMLLADDPIESLRLRAAGGAVTAVGVFFVATALLPL
jgi:urease accessory protein